MLFAVITSGGELDEACVRAAARAAGVSDHIRVEMVVDLRWLEPIEAGVEYYAGPHAPKESDEATRAFLDDLDERLDSYARICAEGAATFGARRVLGMPRKLLGRTARECDVLVLPHPAYASAEIRQAVADAIASPPCPLLIVGTRGRIRSATVCATRSDVPLEDGARDVLLRLLRGRVERLSLPSSFRQEDFAGWAPVVTADGAQVASKECADDQAAGSDFLAILGMPPSRPRLLPGRGRRWQPMPEGNTLLLPA
jgi:hypothetical protein